MFKQEISFDQFNYEKTLSALDMYVKPAAEKLQQEYEALAVLPAFTAQTFDDIRATEGKSVIDAFMAVAEKEATKFKIPSMKDMARRESEKSLNGFKAAWQNYQKSFWEKGMADTTLYPDDIVFDGSGFVANDNIRDRFVRLINTEVEEKVFEAGKVAEKALIDLWEVLTAAGVEMSRTLWTDEGNYKGIFEIEVPSGKPSLHPGIVNLIKQ